MPFLTSAPRPIRRPDGGRHAAEPGRPRRTAGLVAAAAAASTVTVFALIVAFAVTPRSGDGHTPVRAATQSFTVADDVQPIEVTRDSYTSVDQVKVLVAGGTNYDWAKLVLLYAGYPETPGNVTVLTRWMRQENGPPSWWTRDNPLNNGFGSGGGSGTGSYANLQAAAEYCAESLTTYAGYSRIDAGFAASASTSVIEQAIWDSPWAGSHYAHGDHWAYTPVPVVKAPTGSW